MSYAIDTLPIVPIYLLRPAPAIERENVCTMARGCDFGWAIPYRLHRQCIASIRGANWSDVLSRQNRALGLLCNRARRAYRCIGWLSSIEVVSNGQSISDALGCERVLPNGGWDFGRCSTFPMTMRLNPCVCTDPTEHTEICSMFFLLFEPDRLRCIYVVGALTAL